MASVLSRRHFMQSALAASALPAFAASRTQIKIGLYSITYGGVWYRGDALSVEQVIGRARKFGYEGIEIDGKRPHGNPLDMPKARCQNIRKLASDQGIEIYAVAGNNDFSSPIPEHRESQLVYLRELMRMTSDFGAQVGCHAHQLTQIDQLTLPMLRDGAAEIVVAGNGIDLNALVRRQLAYVLAPRLGHVQWISMRTLPVDFDAFVAKLPGTADYLLHAKGIAAVPDAAVGDAVESDLDLST